MPKVRAKKTKKRSFHGNRFSISRPANGDDIRTASSSKLKIHEDNEQMTVHEGNELKGNIIFDITTLISVFSALCCPACFQTGLQLNEDSKFGLCSNFCLVCKCGYRNGFPSTPKNEKKYVLNSLLVLGLRLIGKGYTAGKKLLFTLNLPFLSKSAFRRHEGQLLDAVLSASKQNMNEAAKEVRNLKNNSACGVSVDGTWQRRGHTSLNGCVSAISIDTGKILDLEVMSQYCHVCEKSLQTTVDHICRNYTGSAANMEVVGAYRIFERSVENRQLQYTEYYGDGDSKGYMAVKDIYEKNAVKKLECIGHVQKRVGSRLRKLKKSKKGLGGLKCADISGKWQNELGSRMLLKVGDSNRIAGEYHTAVEAKPGAAAFTSNITGLYTSQGDATLLAFSVIFNHGSSVTSWVGQCTVCDGKEILHTSYNFRRYVTDFNEKWTSIIVNQNTFFRPDDEAGDEFTNSAVTPYSPVRTRSVVSNKQPGGLELSGKWKSSGEEIEIFGVTGNVLTGKHHSRDLIGTKDGNELFTAAIMISPTSKRIRSWTGYISNTHPNAPKVLETSWLVHEFSPSCTAARNSVSFGIQNFTRFDREIENDFRKSETFFDKIRKFFSAMF